MKTALVLPGGLAKGAFEVGVIKELSKHLIPDVVIGSSIGAVNGAILLNGNDIKSNIKKLEYLWLNLKKSSYFRINTRVFLQFLYSPSVMNEGGLKDFVDNFIETDSFEELAKKFYVNVFDLEKNKNVFIDSGSLKESIIASCSYPPFYPPHEINGKLYNDGGVGDETGLKKAEELGCKQIILVNLDSAGQLPRMNIIDSLSNSIQRRNALFIKNEIESIKNSKVISIDIDREYAGSFSSLIDFSLANKLISLGERKIRSPLIERFLSISGMKKVKEVPVKFASSKKLISLGEKRAKEALKHLK